MTTMTQTVQRVSTHPPASAPSPSPAPHLVHGKVTTHLKIDDAWYDLTSWKATHPGGQLILEQMNGNDATGQRRHTDTAPTCACCAALELWSRSLGRRLCNKSAQKLSRHRAFHRGESSLSAERLRFDSERIAHDVSSALSVTSRCLLLSALCRGRCSPFSPAVVEDHSGSPARPACSDEGRRGVP